jgi:hypothetical protein
MEMNIVRSDLVVDCLDGLLNKWKGCIVLWSESSAFTVYIMLFIVLFNMFIMLFCAYPLASVVWSGAWPRGGFQMLMAYFLKTLLTGH